MAERNEAAFARPLGEAAGKQCRAHKGLTKRELFAAMAMQGLCATENQVIDLVVTDAVRLADALINALNTATEPTR